MQELLRLSQHRQHLLPQGVEVLHHRHLVVLEVLVPAQDLLQGLQLLLLHQLSLHQQHLDLLPQHQHKAQGRLDVLHHLHLRDKEALLHLQLVVQEAHVLVQVLLRNLQLLQDLRVVQVQQDHQHLSQPLLVPNSHLQSSSKLSKK